MVVEGVEEDECVVSLAEVASMVDTHRDFNRDGDWVSSSDNGDEGGFDTNSASNEEEDVNPCGANRHHRDHGFILGRLVHSQDLGMKVDNPVFEGEVSSHKVEKSASIWWEHVKKQRLREGKPKIPSCYEMKKKLMAKFLPVHFKCEIIDVVYLQQFSSYNDVCQLDLKVVYRVVMESNEGSVEVPDQVTPIIKETIDVFPNELPPGLPPMRDIQHGNLVWVRLRKVCFPAGRFGKLQRCADGPFRVPKRMNDNAYKIDLPGTYNVLASFNVAYLSPYDIDMESDEEEIEDVEEDSRVNLFQAGEYGALGQNQAVYSMIR
ncbi:hypothetical protein Tco_0085135 [Tanacetum coccineum]